MAKFNAEKDLNHKLYKEQVKKTVQGGSNSNTVKDRFKAIFFKSAEKQVKTIDKAEKKGNAIKAEIEKRKENNKKVVAKIGNNKRR